MRTSLEPRVQAIGRELFEQTSRDRQAFYRADRWTAALLEWSLRHDEALVLDGAATQPRVFDEQLLSQLAASGRGLADLSRRVKPASGIHMLRRDVVRRLLADRDEDETTAAVPVVDGLHARTDAPHATPRPRRTATFLRHLRELVLGE